MAIVLIWIICGVIAGIIGSSKGAGCAGTALGLLLGPFGIIIILVMSGNQKECPHCRKKIHPDATVCPYCQKKQPPREDSAVAPAPAEASDINLKKFIRRIEEG